MLLPPQTPAEGAAGPDVFIHAGPVLATTGREAPKAFAGTAPAARADCLFLAEAALLLSDGWGSWSSASDSFTGAVGTTAAGIPPPPARPSPTVSPSSLLSPLSFSRRRSGRRRAISPSLPSTSAARFLRRRPAAGLPAGADTEGGGGGGMDAEGAGGAAVDTEWGGGCGIDTEEGGRAASLDASAGARAGAPARPLAEGPTSRALRPAAAQGRSPHWAPEGRSCRVTASRRSDSVNRNGRSSSSPPRHTRSGASSRLSATLAPAAARRTRSSAQGTAVADGEKETRRPARGPGRPLSARSRAMRHPGTSSTSSYGAGSSSAARERVQELQRAPHRRLDDEVRRLSGVARLQLLAEHTAAGLAPSRLGQPAEGDSHQFLSSHASERERGGTLLVPFPAWPGGISRSSAAADS
eukprot:scaffold19702_cov98-Isochrysis_galbana.AAC.3